MKTGIPVVWTVELTICCYLHFTFRAANADCSDLRRSEVPLNLSCPTPVRKSFRTRESFSSQPKTLKRQICSCPTLLQGVLVILCKLPLLIQGESRLGTICGLCKVHTWRTRWPRSRRRQSRWRILSSPLCPSPSS